MYAILDPAKIIWSWEVLYVPEDMHDAYEKRGFPTTRKKLVGRRVADSEMLFAFHEQLMDGTYSPASWMRTSTSHYALEREYNEAELEQAKFMAMLIYDAYLLRINSEIEAVKRDDV